MSSSGDLDAESIIGVFNDHRVEYVVIGAFAAIAQNAPVPATHDIDFSPSTDPENVRRLSEALYGLDARIRVADVDEGLPFDPSPDLISRMEMLNLTCRFGDFDLAFRPSGIEGFDELEQRAIRIIVGHTETLVASLEDVIRSKQAAGRPKDLAVLPALERFLAEHHSDGE